MKNDNNEEKVKKPFYRRLNFYLTIILVVVLIFNLNYTIVEVCGTSMNPTYEDGQFLIATRRFELDRFDCVVIYLEEDNHMIIKRVIGLPTETIEYKDNVLYINGQVYEDNYAYGNTTDFKITLKENEYYCLGDNRENSLDSRYYGAFLSDHIIVETRD